MIEPRFLDALRIVCDRLDGCPSPWAITGSLGMALQGMDLEIHDIDLQTDQSGADEIEKRLAEYTSVPVRYLASERIRSYLGAFEIEGVKVEVMGDIQKRLEDGTWEAPVRVEDYRQWLDYDGLRLPVLSLDYEVQAYRKMGRIEKAEKIRRWLDEHRPLKD